MHILVISVGDINNINNVAYIKWSALTDQQLLETSNIYEWFTFKLLLGYIFTYFTEPHIHKLFENRRRGMGDNRIHNGSDHCRIHFKCFLNHLKVFRCDIF